MDSAEAGIEEINRETTPINRKNLIDRPIVIRSIFHRKYKNYKPPFPVPVFG